jgi:hypothetical protein
VSDQEFRFEGTDELIHKALPPVQLGCCGAVARKSDLENGDLLLKEKCPNPMSELGLKVVVQKGDISAGVGQAIGVFDLREWASNEAAEVLQADAQPSGCMGIAHGDKNRPVQQAVIRGHVKL